MGREKRGISKWLHQSHWSRHMTPYSLAHKEPVTLIFYRENGGSRFSSEMSVPVYRTTWHHSIEDNNPIKIHRRGRHVKSYIHSLISCNAIAHAVRHRKHRHITHKQHDYKHHIASVILTFSMETRRCIVFDTEGSSMLELTETLCAHVQYFL